MSDRTIMQVRTIQSKLASRAETQDNQKKIIEGYFIVFDTQTELWPGAYEEIHHDACAKTLGNDIRALQNHETRLVLGRTKVGTLILRVDSHGLYGVIEINENDTEAMNLYYRVLRGDVDQCSFGFNIVSEMSDWRDDGTVKWTITEIDLHEVSVVTFPQYEDTSAKASIELRKADVEAHRAKQFEHKKHLMRERLNNVKTA